MREKKVQERPAANKETDYSEQEARARFERAVDVAVATKPVHKATKAKAKAKR